MSFSEYQTIDMMKSTIVLFSEVEFFFSSFYLFTFVLELIFRLYSFFLLNFSFHFSLSVSSTGTDFLVNLVWLWILFWFNFLFCVIRRNIGDWIHATFLRKKSRHFNALNFIHKKVNRFYCPRTQTMTRGIWSCTVKIDYEVNWFNSQKKFCRLIHIWLKTGLIR